MRLIENNAIRQEITKKNIDVLYKNATEEQKTQILNDVMGDTKRVELHRRALAIYEKGLKQAAIVKELSEEYKAITGKELDKNNLQRMAYIKMDISGTPEAKKNNMEYLISLGDVNFARKEAGRIINEMRKFDVNKFAFKTPEEGLALAEKNYDIYYYMFCSIDIFSDKRFDFDKETNEYISNLRAQVQQGATVVNNINYLASNVYITMPNEETAIVTANASKLSKNYLPYEGTIDNIKKNPTGGMDLVSSSIITSRMTFDYSIDQLKNYPTLFEQDKLKHDLWNYTCTIDGKKATLSEGVDKLCENMKANVSFDKIPDEQLARIENAITNPSLVEIDPNKSKESLLNEYNTKKPVADLINAMKNENNLTVDISEEIFNVVNAAKAADSSRQALGDFNNTYVRSFNAAYKKIYNDIIINGSKIELSEKDGKLVPSMKTSTEIYGYVTKAVGALDELMKNVTKEALNKSTSHHKMKFDELNHTLAGTSPSMLAEGTKSFIMGDNAVKSYQEHFNIVESEGLVGNEKYRVDSSKIFATVEKLKENVISYDKLSMATQAQKQLSNDSNLAIGKMEKDAAAIYVLMREEHRSHNFLWRWFKGSESRAQLNTFKETYCRTFNVNPKNATNHILKLANESSTIGANHNMVTKSLVENKDFENYSEKVTEDLKNLQKVVINNEEQLDEEDKILFNDLVNSIEKVNVNEMDNAVIQNN